MNIRHLLIALSLFSSGFVFSQGWEVEKRARVKYPIKQVQSGTSGCATVQFFIDESGNTLYVEPLRFIEDRIFAEAAVESLQKWKYKAQSTPATKRKTVTIDFSLDTEWDNQGKCHAELTNEPHDIEQFRKQRMSVNIDFSEPDRVLISLKKAAIVMTEQELSLLTNTFSSGFPLDDISELNSLKAYDGYTLDSLIAELKKSNASDITNVENTNKPIHNVEILSLPVKDTMYVWKNWQMRDMAISLAGDLYDEISHELLLVEVAVDDEGNGYLLDTCRSLSPELNTALEETISDWEIAKVKEEAKGFKMLWQLPSPIENGAYIHCDDTWHPEFRPQHFKQRK